MFTSFYDQISRNKRNSVILLALIFLTFILLGYVIARIYSGSFFIIMSGFSVFAIFYIWLGYYSSDKIALTSVNAQPASPEQYRMYHNLVEGLCIASGMPKPKLYIMQSEQINAFATGRDPEHAVICVTTGCLEKLNRSELEGVLGHELSHVANYDIRFMTLAAVLVGMIAIISEMFLRTLWFRNHDSNEKGNAILMLVGILLAILAPIFVQIVQLAISRKREFAADASSVKFTRYPGGLINALKKIGKESIPEKRANKAVAPLFISDPFKRKVQGFFQTHPPVQERIKVLEQM